MDGRHLGVKIPSLYGYYTNRDEVFDAVANLLTRQVDTSGFDTGDWRHGFITWARCYRGV
jgi:AcrR family transcriptional regulator